MMGVIQSFPEVYLLSPSFLLSCILASTNHPWAVGSDSILCEGCAPRDTPSLPRAAGYLFVKNVQILYGIGRTHLRTVLRTMGNAVPTRFEIEPRAIRMRARTTRATRKSVSYGSTKPFVLVQTPTPRGHESACTKKRELSTLRSTDTDRQSRWCQKNSVKASSLNTSASFRCPSGRTKFDPRRIDHQKFPGSITFARYNATMSRRQRHDEISVSR